MSTYTGPVSFTADGGDTTFSVPFPYLSSAHVLVKIDDVEQELGTDYTLSGSTVTFAAAPTSGLVVQISRVSGLDDADYLVGFTTDMRVTARVLQLIGLQPWYALQEIAVAIEAISGIEDLASALFYDSDVGGYDAISRKIRNVAQPSFGTDAATKSYVDSIAEYGIGAVPIVLGLTTDGGATYTLTGVPDVQANNLIVFIGGSVQKPTTDYTTVAGSPDSTITFTSTPPSGLQILVFVTKSVKFVPATSIDPGSILTAMLADGSVTADKLAALAVTADKLATGSVTASKIPDASITGSKLVDGTVTAGKLASGALAGSIGYAELKTTGFTSAPGGSVDQVMMIDRTTGDQVKRVLTASDVSNFNSSVNAKRLDEFAAPTSNVAMGSQRLTGLADPVDPQDAATKAHVASVLSGANNDRGPFLIAEEVLGTPATLFDAEWSDTSFVRYEVVIENVDFSASSSPVGLRFRNQALGTYSGSNYKHESVLSQFGGSSGGSNSSSDDNIIIGSSWTDPGAIRFDILNSKHDYGFVEGVFINQLGASRFSGRINPSGDVSGVRLMTDGVNILAGAVMRVYGYTTL